MYFPFRFPFKPNNEMQELYLNRLLRTFGYAIVYSFISIYIIVNGYSLAITVSYFLYSFLFIGLLAPLPMIVARRIGYKHTAMFYVPSVLLFFFFLYTLPKFNWPIPLVSLFYALNVLFYWMPVHTLFAIDGKEGHRGYEAGVITSISYAASIFAPMIGAIIIQNMGFVIAFLVSGFFLLISIFPLFLTPDIKIKVEHSFFHFFKFEKLFEKEFLATGLIYAALEVWPLYVFLFHETYIFVGLVGFLAGLGCAVFSFLIGYFADHFSKNKLMQIGGVILCFLWLVPLFYINDIIVSMLSFCYGFFFSLIDLPFYSMTCTEAKKEGAAEFMIFREITLSTGRVLAFLFMFIFLDFKVIFFLAFLSSLYFALPKRLK